MCGVPFDSICSVLKFLTPISAPCGCIHTQIGIFANRKIKALPMRHCPLRTRQQHNIHTYTQYAQLYNSRVQTPTHRHSEKKTKSYVDLCIHTDGGWW